MIQPENQTYSNQEGRINRLSEQGVVAPHVRSNLVGNDGAVGCSGEQREGGLYLVSGRGYQLVKRGTSLSSGL